MSLSTQIFITDKATFFSKINIDCFLSENIADQTVFKYLIVLVIWNLRIL